MQSDKSKINIFPSVEVRAMRDSGATATIVNAKLVKPEQFLEDTVKVTYANIQKFDICKTAKVWVESPWITGEIEVIVMDTPAQDLIIGNTHIFKDITVNEVMYRVENKNKNDLLEHEALIVQTRSHKKIIPEIECPTVLFNEIGVSRDELITMQKTDPTIKELLNKDYNKINLNNHNVVVNDLAVRCNRKINNNT